MRAGGTGVSPPSNMGHLHKIANAVNMAAEDEKATAYAAAAKLDGNMDLEGGGLGDVEAALKKIVIGGEDGKENAADAARAVAAAKPGVVTAALEACPGWAEFSQGELVEINMVESCSLGGQRPRGPGEASDDEFGDDALGGLGGAGAGGGTTLDFGGFTGSGSFDDDDDDDEEGEDEEEDEEEEDEDEDEADSAFDDLRGGSFDDEDEDDDGGVEDNAFSNTGDWEPNLSSTMARYGYPANSGAAYGDDDGNEIEEEESAQQGNDGNDAWEADFSSASFADNGDGDGDVVKTDAGEDAGAAEGGWVANFGDAFGNDGGGGSSSPSAAAAAVPAAIDTSPKSPERWATKVTKPKSPRSPSASPERKDEDDSQTNFNDASFWGTKPAALSPEELAEFSLS